MTTRIVMKQRPAARPITKTTRGTPRENPSFTGSPTWGQPNWPDSVADVALNITELIFPSSGAGRRVAPFANLTQLKADPIWGDTVTIPYNSGASFTTGQFIRLANNTQAYYVGGGTKAWSAGTAP